MMEEYEDSSQYNYASLKKAFTLIKQKTAFFCSAASTEMILRYYDVFLNQDSIYTLFISRNLIDDGLPGPEMIKDALDGLEIEKRPSSSIKLSCEYIERIDINKLIEEIDGDYPVMISYTTNAEEMIWHAVVVIAIKYKSEAPKSVLLEIGIMDPATTDYEIGQSGICEWQNKDFINAINGMWIIRTV